MKVRELVFPHPMKVLQLYSHVLCYTKRLRSYSDRQETMTWDIESKQGYVADGKLYLPESAIEHMKLDGGTAIVIHDRIFAKEKGVFAVDEGSQSGNTTCIDLTSEGAGSSMFTFRQADELELYLADINKLPKRKGFKISNLRLHEPVEVRLNFKDSMPLQGTERYLEEHTDIFTYIGNYDRCYLMREPFDAVKKHVPHDAKVVNLLKELWM